MSTTAETLPFPDPPQFTSISAVADWAMDVADGDWQQTDAIIKDLLENDAEIKSALLDPLISKATWAAVRAAGHRRRRKLLHDEPPMAEGEDSTTGIKLVSARNWYDFPLPGGKKLGDATHDDLVFAAEFHNLQAVSNASRSRWFTRMADQMPEDSLVRDVLSLEQIEGMTK